MKVEIMDLYNRISDSSITHSERLLLMYKLISISFSSKKADRFSLSELGMKMKDDNIPNYRDLIFLYGCGLRLLAYHHGGTKEIEEYVI